MISIVTEPTLELREITIGGMAIYQKNLFGVQAINVLEIQITSEMKVKPIVNIVFYLELTLEYSLSTRILHRLDIVVKDTEEFFARNAS